MGGENTYQDSLLLYKATLPARKFAEKMNKGIPLTKKEKEDWDKYIVDFNKQMQQKTPVSDAYSRLKPKPEGKVFPEGVCAPGSSSFANCYFKNPDATQEEKTIKPETKTEKPTTTAAATVASVAKTATVSASVKPETIVPKKEMSDQWTPPTDELVAPAKTGWTPPADELVKKKDSGQSGISDSTTSGTASPSAAPSSESGKFPPTGDNIVDTESTDIPSPEDTGLSESKSGKRSYFNRLESEKIYDSVPDAPSAPSYTPPQRALILGTIEKFEENPIFKNEKYRDIYFQSLGESGMQLKSAVENEIGVKKASNVVTAPIDALKHVAESVGEMGQDLMNPVRGIANAKGESTAEKIAGVAVKPIQKTIEAGMGALAVTPPGAVFTIALKGIEEASPEVAEKLNAVLAPASTLYQEHVKAGGLESTLAEGVTSIADAIWQTALFFGAHKGGKALVKKFNPKNVKPEHIEQAAEYIEQLPPEKVVILQERMGMPEVVEWTFKENNLEKDLANLPPDHPAAEIITQELAVTKEAIENKIAETVTKEAETTVHKSTDDYLAQEREELAESLPVLSENGKQLVDQSIKDIEKQYPKLPPLEEQSKILEQGGIEEPITQPTNEQPAAEISQGAEAPKTQTEKINQNENGKSNSEQNDTGNKNVVVEPDATGEIGNEVKQEKLKDNAIQEPSAEKILPGEPKENGSKGSERPRVGSEQPGGGLTGESAGKEKTETPGESKGDVNESEVREDIVKPTRQEKLKAKLAELDLKAENRKLEDILLKKPTKNAILNDEGIADAVEMAKAYIDYGAGTIKDAIDLSVKYFKEKFNIDLDSEDIAKIQSELESKNKGLKDKSLLNRAHKAKNATELKDAIAEHGLQYEVEKWQDARAEADNFIAEVGIENALDAVRKNLLPTESASKAYIFAKAVESAKDKAYAETDPVRKIELIREAADLFAEMDAISRGAGRWNAALKDIYDTSDIGYDLAAIINKAKAAAKEEGISPKVEKELADMAQEIDNLNKQLAEQREKYDQRESEIEFEKIQEALKLEDALKKAQPKGASKKLADKILERDKKRTDKEADAIFESAKRENAVRKVVEKVKEGLSIEKAVEKVAEEGLIKPENVQKAKDYFKELTKEEAVPEVTEEGKIIIPDALIRELVESGIDNINDLAKAVHERLTPEQQEQFTHRNVRDTITKYGKQKFPSKDEISRKIAELKRDGQLLSGLEDAVSGKAPLKSGFIRPKVTDQQRDLMKKIKDAMKELPEDAADIKRKWATAQDRITTVLTNKIADLKKQIKEEKREERNTKQVERNEQNKGLQEQIDDLNKQLDNLVGKKELTHEQRVNTALKAIEKSEAEYLRREKEKDFAPKVKQELQDPRLDEAKKKRDEAKEKFETSRDATIQKKTDLEKLVKKAADLTQKIGEAKKEGKKVDAEQLAKEQALTEGEISNLVNEIIKQNKDPEQIELARKIKDKQEAIDALRDKLSKGDFSKEPKKEGITSPELEALREEHEQLLDFLAKKRKELTYRSPEEIATENALKSAERELDKVTEQITNEDLDYKTKNSKVIETEQLKATRQALKDSRELLNQMREEAGVAEKRRVELYKKKLQTDIAKLNEQLETGVYDKKVKREKPDDTEIRKLESDKIAAKEKVDLAIEKLRLKNRTTLEIIADISVDVLNIPRSLLASADLSAGFRQGVVLAAWHPVRFTQAFIHQFNMLRSEKVANDWLHAVKASEAYPEMQRAELYLSEPNTKLAAKEEQFISNLAHKIPIYGKVIKASERAYTGFLNKLRVDVFNDFRETLVKDGFTGKELDAELKAYAGFINQATGRGNLGSFFNTASPILNTAFFSPRYFASRVNLMYKAGAFIPQEIGVKLGVKSAEGSRARREAMKSIVAYVVAGLTVLALAKAGGAEVEDNPTSSNFGKIKTGGVTRDIWAGFQQIVVLLMRLFRNETKNINTGEVEQLGGDNERNIMTVMGDFGESKFSPPMSMAFELGRRENKYDKSIFGYDLGDRGDPITTEGMLLGNLAPMWQQDIWDIKAEQGVLMAVEAGTESFFGIGVQYNDENAYIDKKIDKQEEKRKEMEDLSKLPEDDPKREEYISDKVKKAKAAAEVRKKMNHRRMERGMLPMVEDSTTVSP